jgi:hypothetical protein
VIADGWRRGRRALLAIHSKPPPDPPSRGHVRRARTRVSSSPGAAGRRRSPASRGGRRAGMIVGSGGQGHHFGAMCSDRKSRDHRAGRAAARECVSFHRREPTTAEADVFRAWGGPRWMPFKPGCRPSTRIPHRSERAMTSARCPTTDPPDVHLTIRLTNRSGGADAILRR